MPEAYAVDRERLEELASRIRAMTTPAIPAEKLGSLQRRLDALREPAR
ncbi:MAG: hypothetical protein KY447_09410 [Actinobacteria bacterium]|nr:hypothetical protein [Actinomycetota bacterium]